MTVMSTFATRSVKANMLRLTGSTKINAEVGRESVLLARVKVSTHSWTSCCSDGITVAAPFLIAKIANSKLFLSTLTIMGMDRLSCFLRNWSAVSNSQSLSKVTTIAFAAISWLSLKRPEGVEAIFIPYSFKFNNFGSNSSLLALIHNIVVELIFFTLETLVICQFH